MHNEGLTCPRCRAWFAWRDLECLIQSLPDLSLLWSFLCPICRRVLRAEPFAFPPDFVPEYEEEELEDTG